MQVEGRFIIIIILALSGYSCLIWYRAYKRLINVESPAVNKLYNAYIKSDEAALRAYLNSEGDSIAVPLLFNTLKTGTFDPDSLEYYHWIHWPRYFAGIFVFIGLLGTVWGIAIAMNHLGPIVDPVASVDPNTSGGNASFVSIYENLTNVTKGISSLLSGMMSATYCTLVGLVSTVLVSMLNTYYMSISEKIINKISAVANGMVIPLQSSERKLEDENRILVELKTAIQMLDVSIKSLMGANESVKSSFNNASSHVAGLVDNLTTVTKRVSNVIQQINLATKNIESTVHASAERMSTTIAQLDTIVSRIEQSLGSNIERLNLTVTDLSEVARKISEEINAGYANADVVQKAATQTVQSVRLLQEQVVEMMSRLEGSQNNHLNTIATAHERLIASIMRFESLLLDAAAIIESSPIQHRLYEVLDKIENDLRAYEERGLQSLQTTAQRLENLEEKSQANKYQLQKLIEDLNNVTTLLQRNLEELSRRHVIYDPTKESNRLSANIPQRKSIMKRLLAILKNKRGISR